MTKFPISQLTPVKDYGEIMVKIIYRILFALCQILFVVSILSAQETDSQKAYNLNARVVQLYRQGKYAEAIPLAQEALHLREHALGPDHKEVATSLNTLAGLYRAMDAYGQAEPLYQRALKIRETKLGIDHIDVSQTLNNLALLYDAMGSYGQAIPLLSRALRIRETKLGPDHPDVAQTLNNLAALYRNMGSYGQAESLYQRALIILEEQLGPYHMDVATGLNNLAFLYYTKGLYSQAVPLLQRALKICEARLPPDDPQVAASLNGLAFLFNTTGVYAQAESLYLRALKIQEAKLGPDHPNIALSLNNLAELYRAMGVYEQAEPLYQRALKIRETKLGPDHQDVAQSLNNLAVLFDAIGAYDQAEPLFQRALKIYEARLGPKHPEVATTLDNLANLYRATGAYGQAEPLYRRALKIYEARSGSDHPNVARTLNNWAELYRATAAYGQAEPLYQRALKIVEEKLGPDHPNVATSLSTWAELYQAMGAYRQAEPLLRRALKIREAKLGPDHPDVASSLNNLAGLYCNKGEYRQAEPLLQRVLKIYEAKLGSDHPYVATSSNNLGFLYHYMGAYDQAEPYYQRAMKILEAQLGPDHPNVATNLNNLAVLYQDMGADSQAEPLFQRALKIREEKFGPEHPDVAQSLNNMIYLWGAMGNFAKIIPASKRLLRLSFQQYHIVLPYLYLSEKRQLDYVQKNSPLSSLWPSLYVQYGGQSAELKPLTSEVLLNQKGIVYEILASRSRSQKSGGTTLQDSLNGIRSQLANASFMDLAASKNVEEWRGYLESLQAEQERLESQLARQGHNPETTKTPLASAQLCQALPEDYALVDFWYFPKYNFVGEKKGWGTRQYLAVVYQKNHEPEILQLGDADSLHHRLIELRQAILSTKLDPTQTREQYSTAEAVIKAKGRQLYRQLFKPLLSALGDKKKVIICADGALHYLPFGVLVDEQNRYLVESYQFHYVSTSREIVQWGKGARGKKDEAVIIADPQFDFAPAQKVASVASKSFEQELSTRHSRDWRQMGFGQLKYTRPEAVAIDSLLKQKGIATKLYLQDQAQEAVLKSVVSPQILHISTHGFFLPDQPELRKPKEIGGFSSIGEFDRTPALENPLLRCGLAFAGANHAESVKEGEDGLATAMEIAGLDLQGTDLVTLSACLTGVGELKSGEGVYGLHRSFLLAGAKTVLASLWSVPDLETKDLMVEFYRRYLFGEKISKSEALRQAQLAVIEQLRKKYGAAHPAYWGAFVCIGEP